MQIDTFGMYVDARLRAWAREISGGATDLGYPQTNMLHRDHTFASGQRPVAMSDEAFVTEKIIIELRKEAPDEAVVLESVYFGHGRWSEERREDAELYLGRTLTKRKFWAMYNSAFQRVREIFEILAKLN